MDRSFETFYGNKFRGSTILDGRTHFSKHFTEINFADQRFLMAAPIFRNILRSLIFAVREESAKTVKIWRYTVCEVESIWSQALYLAAEAHVVQLARKRYRLTLSIFFISCFTILPMLSRVANRPSPSLLLPSFLPPSADSPSRESPSREAPPSCEASPGPSLPVSPNLGIVPSSSDGSMPGLSCVWWCSEGRAVRRGRVPSVLALCGAPTAARPPLMAVLCRGPDGDSP